MGIIIKQSIRNALVSYTGVIIGFISTVKLFPNILSTAEFGLTRTLLAIMLIGSQIVSFGIPNSIVKQFTFLSTKTEYPRRLFSLFLIPIISTFIFFVAVFLVSEKLIVDIYKDSPLLTEYFLFAIPLVLFSSLFSVLNSYLTALLNTVFASFLKEVFLRIATIFGLILFYFEVITFKVFVIVFVANYGLIFLILLFYALKLKLLELKISFDIITKPIVKKVGVYSLYSFFGGLTMILVGNIDVLMLSAYEDLEQTGIYAIAFYVGSVIGIPRRSVSKISFPIVAKAFENDKLDEIKKVYQQTSLNQFLGGFLIFIGVWANMDNLYSMLPPEYATGGIVILIVGMANLFDMISGVNGQIVLSSKYFRYDLIFTSFLVVLAIISNIIFIPLYGIMGAAIATGFSLFIYNVIKLIFVWVKFSIHPFTLRTLGMIVNGTTVLLFSFLLPNFENIYIDIVVRSLLMLSLYVSIIWIFNLSLEFKEAFRGILKKVF